MFGSRRAVFARTLRRGDHGEDVRELQELLRGAGFEPGRPDGNFGQSTHAGVVALQRAQDLVPDGAAGARTMATLTQIAVQTGRSAGQTRTALSLHIGLNQVDEAAYGFEVPELSGCINDANDMQNLAQGKGFRPRQLLNSAATSAAVIASIREAARRLNAGDLFWISYSGHGSQIPDPLEPDQHSETWVLWDRQLIDNELYTLWGQFRPGVRILVISDSCHSGTVTRELLRLHTEVSQATAEAQQHTAAPRIVMSPTTALDLALTLADAMAPVLDGAGITRPGAARRLASEVVDQLVTTRMSVRGLESVERPRLLPEPLAAHDADRRASIYRDVLATAVGVSAPECKVLLISGCQDNQTSSDGRPDPSGHQNGAFTKALRTVWESAIDYANLHSKILSQLPSTQSPNLYWATPRDTAFETQPPFTI